MCVYKYSPFHLVYRTVWLLLFKYFSQLVMSAKGRSNKSLCEKSMEMMTNIVKLSSLSIAQRTLGTSSSPPATKRVETTLNNQPQPLFPQSLRSEEPKPISFLIHPAEGNEASNMIREETVDGRASDYIRKVRDRNNKFFDETYNLSADIMPPPPHAVLY